MREPLQLVPPHKYCYGKMMTPFQQFIVIRGGYIIKPHAHLYAQMPEAGNSKTAHDSGQKTSDISTNSTARTLHVLQERTILSS